MTDERYVYTQDQRDRKRTASGARARKGGSRANRCPLPSDALTKAQREKLNGPVEQVNLNRPMTYAELKLLNKSMQHLYLDHLVTAHKARRVDLQAMLGIAPSTMYKLASSLPEKLAFTGKPKRPAREWLAFLAAAQEAAQAQADLGDGHQAPSSEDAPVAAPEPPSALLAGSITVRATASGMLAAILRLIDEPKATYTFTVNFTQ